MNKLETFNQKQKLIFDYSFGEAITDRSLFFQFPGNVRKIGVVAQQSNEIYLFNSNGTIYEGFPLEGKTLFSIGHMNPGTTKFNLIVGSNDGFLYNYEVH